MSVDGTKRTKDASGENVRFWGQSGRQSRWAMSFVYDPDPTFARSRLDASQIAAWAKVRLAKSTSRGVLYDPCGGGYINVR
jgi:hypothetical protein